MAVFEGRLATIEKAVDDFVSVFERKVDQLARRGANPRRGTRSSRISCGT